MEYARDTGFKVAFNYALMNFYTWKQNYMQLDLIQESAKLAGRIRAWD